MPFESQASKRLKFYPKNVNQLTDAILQNVDTAIYLIQSNLEDENPCVQYELTPYETVFRFMMEYKWNKNGREIYFLENMWLIEAILNSKIELDGDCCFKTISDSYCIMPPKGFMIGSELEVHSILVTNSSSHVGERYEMASELQDWQERGGDAEIDWYAAKEIERKELDKTLKKESDPCINFTIHGKYKNKATYIDLSVKKSEVAALLQKKEKKINRIFSTVFKLVIGLTVYLQAGGKINDGLPNSKASTNGALKSTKKLSSIPKKLSTVRLPFKLKQTPKGHIRGFHFRNLKAECYYGGDFANWERGSRWAFVNPYWVGKGIDAKSV